MKAPRIAIVSPSLYCWVKQVLHNKTGVNTMHIKTTKAPCPKQLVLTLTPLQLNDGLFQVADSVSSND